MFYPRFRDTSIHIVVASQRSFVEITFPRVDQRDQRRKVLKKKKKKKINVKRKKKKERKEKGKNGGKKEERDYRNFKIFRFSFSNVLIARDKARFYTRLRFR